MSQIVLTSIYNKLISATGAGSVYATVGGRIYQIEAPQAAALPCLVYAITDNEVTTFFGTTAKSRQDLIVQNSFFFALSAASAVATAMNVEATLFDLLNRQTITPSDASYTSMEMFALNRGVPDIGEDFITVETSYRFIAIKDT